MDLIVRTLSTCNSQGLFGHTCLLYVKDVRSLLMICKSILGILRYFSACSNGRNMDPFPKGIFLNHADSPDFNLSVEFHS